MKTEIEKKLGCSIEQFLEGQQAQLEWAISNNMEADGPTGLEVLSEDELMFMAGYAEHLLGEESRQSA